MTTVAKHSYKFGSFRLDPAERQLLCAGQPVALTPKCFDLLVVLVENSGHLLEKEELLGRLWPDQFVEEGNLSFNISALRKALGEGRNGERFIETVPKKGFRFVAQVTERGDDESTLDDQNEALPLENNLAAREQPTGRVAAAEHGALPVYPAALARRFLSWKTFAVLLLAGALILLAYRLWTRRAETRAAGSFKTIAVLPFKPLSTDSRDESLEMGMAETLITKLSNIKQLVVRPVSAVRKYTDSSQDPVKAGQELQTEAVLDGSIQKAGDRVRVTVRLMNVQSGATLWVEHFDENFTDIFKVQDSISERVTDALRLKLSGDEAKLLAKRYTDNPEAYQLYLQGDNLWYKWDDKSLEFYQRAIEKDPKFALAYIGTAESYLHLVAKNKMSAQEGIPQARTAITKALALDETLAEAQNAEAVAERLKIASINGLKPEEIEESKEAFRVSGWQGFLQIMRARMEERAKNGTVIPTNMAVLYARLGDKEMAFAWLEKALDERDPSVVRLKIEPVYDGLRSDPRYAKLLERMNLTP